MDLRNEEYMALWLEWQQSLEEMSYQGAELKADGRLQFRPKRLKRKSLILALRFGTLLNTEYFKMRYLKYSNYCLGITTKRKIGKACIRNYIRRRTRHAFEVAAKRVAFVKPYAFMIYSNSESKDVCFENLVNIFVNFFEKI